MRYGNEGGAATAPDLSSLKENIRRTKDDLDHRIEERKRADTRVREIEVEIRRLEQVLKG